MRNILSIFSSRSCPYLGGLLVVLIIVTEITMSRVLPGRFFSHEVDRALHNIDDTASEAELVFIGDSVGRQLVRGAWRAGQGGARKWKDLVTNQVIEAAGNYYMLKRYLRRHKKPAAVIYVAGAPDDVDLEGDSNENFIQRCFLRADEMAELTYYKGFRFGFVMLVHKLFPSYRYRYHLQKKLLGFSNASIYDGIRRESDETAVGLDAKESLQIEDTLYGIYFKKMLDLLSEESVDFYYIFPPVSEASWSKREDRYRAMKSFLDSLRFQYRVFRGSSDLPIYPDSAFKKDEFHFQKGTGQVRATRFLLDHIILIQESYQ